MTNLTGRQRMSQQFRDGISTGPEAVPMSGDQRQKLLDVLSAHRRDFVDCYQKGELEGAILTLNKQEDILLQLGEQQSELVSLFLNRGFLNFKLAEQRAGSASQYLEEAKGALLAGLTVTKFLNYPEASSDEMTLKANLAHVLERIGEVAEAETILKGLLVLAQDCASRRNERKLSLELFYKRQGRFENALNLAREGLDEALQRQDLTRPTTEVAAYLSRIWRYHTSLGQEYEGYLWAKRYRDELECVGSCLDAEFLQREMMDLRCFLKP